MPKPRYIPSPDILRLLESRWAVPILAELHRGSAGVDAFQGGGAKFVTLSRRLGVSPDTLSRTLNALIEQGWVVRNPGYGHPIRPEYLLSERGLALAAACSHLLAEIDALGPEVRSTLLRKWSLPIALALATGSGRFTDIKDALPGVTARALAQTLKGLEAGALVQRRILDEYPPRPRYELRDSTRALLPSLRELQALLAA